jgi:hypothetical protein
MNLGFFYCLSTSLTDLRIIKSGQKSIKIQKF